MKAAEAERVKILKEDITKIPREQSQKLLSKEDVKKKYPGFTDANMTFYLDMLTEYMRMGLGIITRDQILKKRYFKELSVADKVFQKIEDDLKTISLGKSERPKFKKLKSEEKDEKFLFQQKLREAKALRIKLEEEVMGTHRAKSPQHSQSPESRQMAVSISDHMKIPSARSPRNRSNDVNGEDKNSLIHRSMDGGRISVGQHEMMSNDDLAMFNDSQFTIIEKSPLSKNGKREMAEVKLQTNVEDLFTLSKKNRGRKSQQLIETRNAD